MQCPYCKARIRRSDIICPNRMCGELIPEPGDSQIDIYPDEEDEEGIYND